jgi:hypothetical protein
MRRQDINSILGTKSDTIVQNCNTNTPMPGFNGNCFSFLNSMIDLTIPKIVEIDMKAYMSSIGIPYALTSRTTSKRLYSLL